MGCATSTHATEIEKASSQLERAKSVSKLERAKSTISALSRKASRQLSFHSTQSARLAGKSEKLEESAEVEEATPARKPSEARFLSGPPLTLLESRFDAKRFRCTSCGNTGLGMDGRFCKCPYGRRDPPARLSDGEVEVNVGPLTVGPDEQVRLPKMKLGIRGSYIYEGCGRNKVADKTWSQTHMTCAASGPTWSEIIRQVQVKAKRTSAKALLDAMPEILLAVQRSTNVDLVQECNDAYKATDSPLKANGVVYTFSTNVDSEVFLDLLDMAGYNSVVYRSDRSRELEFATRVSLSHDRRIVRVSVYQATARVSRLRRYHAAQEAASRA